MRIKRSISLKEVDNSGLIFTDFNNLAFTPGQPLNFFAHAVFFPKHSLLCVLSHLDRCRLQRELDVNRVFEEYRLCTSCIVWETGWNLVALLLAYTLV
jgi:hypothetical protein